MKNKANWHSETAYLLKSPTNARRLLAAMEQLEAGKGKRRKATIRKTKRATNQLCNPRIRD
jgi:PHD/YefM family antitoxin component YafN of YafNO toxin-antitoxin module